MQNCTTTLEKSLVVFYTVKLTIGAINSTLKYLPKRNEDISTHKDLFIVALSIIAIKWKAPKIHQAVSGPHINCDHISDGLFSSRVHMIRSETRAEGVLR